MDTPLVVDSNQVSVPTGSGQSAPLVVDPNQVQNISQAPLIVDASQVQPAQQTVQMARYVAPGQGIQEFTQGSPEEKDFLTRFPQAKSVPIPSGVGGKTTPSYAAQVNTPYQQAEAARIAEGDRKAGNALKTAAVVGGSIIAPELAPEAGLLLSTGLAAGGAATGTVAGQVASGENPISEESLKQTGINAALYGGGQLVGGVAGKLIGKVADALTAFAKPAANVGEQGSKLVEQIAGDTLPTQEQVVKNVQAQLERAEAELHTNYETKLNQISADAKNVPVSLADSPLRETAQELLNDTKIPESLRASLKGVIPDSDRIAPLLTALSDESKVFSWDEVEATRQAIGGQIRKLAYNDPIRPDLIKIRYAIDDTLEKAAGDADKPELSAQIKDLRGRYAQKIQLFQDKAIKALSDKSPNTVADILLSGRESIENVKTLRNLIGEENMKQVEGSILDRLIQRSTVGDEINAKGLRTQFYKMPPDVKQAVWGDNLPAVTSFMDGVVKANARGKASQMALNLLAHYGLGTGAVSGGIAGLGVGLIRGDDPVKIARDIAVGSAIVAGGKYGPEILSKYAPQITSVGNAAGPAITTGIKAATGLAQAATGDDTEKPADNSAGSL
jgi:hypothetical protein